MEDFHYTVSAEKIDDIGGDQTLENILCWRFDETTGNWKNGTVTISNITQSRRNFIEQAIMNRSIESEDNLLEHLEIIAKCPYGKGASRYGNLHIVEGTETDYNNTEEEVA